METIFSQPLNNLPKKNNDNRKFCCHLKEILKFVVHVKKLLISYITKSFESIKLVSFLLRVKSKTVSLYLAEKHFPENHLPEKHFPERSFSRINICQKSHLPE